MILEEKLFDTAQRYMDGELPETDRAAFEKRLREDKALSVAVADLKALGREAAELPVLTAPAVDLSGRSPAWRFPLPIYGPFAAGLAAAVLLVMLGFGLGKYTTGPPAPAAPVLKPVSLRLVYYAPGANTVAVIGDFNDWSGEIPLAEKGRSGYWHVELEVIPGEYQYTLILNGEEQVVDPTADYVVDDDFGSRNSVVRVGI